MEPAGTGQGAADTAAVDRTIRARRTSKLMLSPERIGQAGELWNQTFRADLETMIEGAAWAPFHRRADEKTHRGGTLDAVVPWRFHVLERPACLSLLEYLRQQVEIHPDSKWTQAWQSKIKSLLAACGALVQATWLPDPSEGSGAPVLSRDNVEHIAAASAAVQNLLLAAEARGWRSYWSSGGVLRDEEVFDLLGIGNKELLLGSIFLAPVVAESCMIVEGGLRNQRGSVEGWARWVSLS